MELVILNVLHSRDDVFKALLQSKKTKSIIGINSKSLGPGTYMTSVVELVTDQNDDTIVVLQSYDMTGYFFDTSALKLEEIESVIPFTALFENPFLRGMKRALGT